MIEWPKITVVTPSFNQGTFLRATLESIHDPGYPNLEHIVIDGGSTDESVEILREYDEVLAFWVSEPDAGQTAALARGFELASGEILCWLNSDDLFEPYTLFDVGRFFFHNPAVSFIYGDATWIDEAGHFLKRQREHRFSRFIWMWGHNYLPQPSVFWRRELYRAVGGLDPTFDLAMDADLWARFMDVAAPVHVPKLWSRMRFYPEQKNTRLRAESEREVERIRTRHRGPSSRPVAWGKQRAARFARIGLKLGSARYGVREVVEHAGSVFGESWEDRAARRGPDMRDDR